jgi:hypothetical protein
MCAKPTAQHALLWPVQLARPSVLLFAERMLTNLCIHVRACRDEQLAKFEAYLNKEGCLHINCIVRPRSRMAYPMKKK